MIIVSHGDLSGRTTSDTSAAAKHILAELKSAHVQVIERAVKKPEEPCKQIPTHNLQPDFNSMSLQLDAPNPATLCLGNGSMAALSFLRTHADMPELSHASGIQLALQDTPAADDSLSVRTAGEDCDDAPARSLMELRRSASELDCLDQSRTVSSIVNQRDAQNEPPRKRRRTNGWIVFWKDLESVATPRPGQSKQEHRLQVLADCKRQWAEDSFPNMVESWFCCLGWLLGWLLTLQLR